MGVIVHVNAVVGPGSITTGMVGATTINNDLDTAATNPCTLDTTIASPNVALDWEVLVADSGGTTEYRFTNTVRNTSSSQWNKFWMQLGFFTGASFQISGISDDLDFDTSGVLGAENFQPPPTYTFPPENITVATSYSANDMIWGTGVGAGIYATPVTGVNTVGFSIDVPDWSAAFMPALASIVGGYRFTLRQFGLATPVAATATYAYAWVR